MNAYFSSGRLIDVKKRQYVNRVADMNDRCYLIQKTTGRFWVRERIGHYLDPAGFREVGSIAGLAKYHPDGTLKSQVEARDVIVAAGDFVIRGGHADGAVWGKSLFAEQLARRVKMPMVRLIDGSSGGRSVTLMLEKGATYLPPLFVVTAALGSAVGLGAARATLSHFSVVAQDIGSLFSAVTKESLGGAHIHVSNGTFDNLTSSEQGCFGQIRAFPSYMPTNSNQFPPLRENRDPRMYQVRDILVRVVDKDSWFEIGHQWGDSAVCGLDCFNGRVVGVLSFDCTLHGSVLSSLSCQKFRHPIDLCDTLDIPVLSFADYAGFVVGTKAEKEATIRHGSTLTAALYQCDVQHFSIVLRKIFGVAGAAFVDNRTPNMPIAWPSGDWGSLPLEGGIYPAYKRELDAAGEKRNGLYEKIMSQFEAVRPPIRTAETFDPRDTRPMLCEWAQLMYDHVLPQRLEKVRTHGPRILYRP
ncbi:ClpP/crotonase-like domain-containing protein [Sporodiniella umbellata]|nr:ClpP/crotonase-like domain-containing protein [Sporodiniella umbellata]